MSKIITGVWAAASTPRRADGSLDEAAFQGALTALMDRGIRGFVINGGTGEYCLTTREELCVMLKRAAEITRGRAEFACCVGSAGLHGCTESGNLAMEAGAKALLLPMPYFFPYEQDDLEAFCREVAVKLGAPILLYNLPSFTTPIESSTVQRLIEECPNIVGIKDSSGSLEIMRSLKPDACRIVGSDNALAQARKENVCDAVISGVASAMPELILACWERDANAARRLDEFIEQISGFPVPWGVKLVAGYRGFAPAHFSQPLSRQRRKQMRQLEEWFQTWHVASESVVEA